MVEVGERIAIIGPNGIGKTTLLAQRRGAEGVAVQLLLEQ